MSRPILGIHHVTAIAGDAQRNVDFYAGMLGLRFVKRTVNYDDPFTYHFYYGDDTGSPGTILTFFPWAGVPRGRRGAGQVVRTALAVPRGSLDAWELRLRGDEAAAQGVRVGARSERFGEAALSFEDPDGLGLELIESGGAAATAPGASPPMASDEAIRGFHGVTLLERALEPTASLLVDELGWTRLGVEGNRTRFLAATDGAEGPARLVDVVADPEAPSGRLGAGIVHHVAWRTPDDASQSAWREHLVRGGHGVSPVMDRKYFHSIYFREPGGVLFEIATDPPGFTVDEPLESLGTSLLLPDAAESYRGEIEARLPRLVVPSHAAGTSAG